MIEVRHIQVKRGNKVIVHDASFHIIPGKVCVLIGKNGAGKSTLLDAICGRHKFLSGEVIWENKHLRKIKLKDLAAYRAVLSQQISLNFALTVKQVVEMGTYAYGNALTKREVKEQVTMALEEVEMLDFLERSFSTLSGGEQKRVLLAKCLTQLLADPDKIENKYLFLDEPTASLDLNQQHKLIELVKTLIQKYNIGVFTVMHDINLAALFADTLLTMKEGIITHSGTPTHILQPDILKDTLDINAIIHIHPILGCPQVTALPL
ncbi:MAG: ATP-binding cassette domain-containing protein [Bacteroidota bacterium]